MPTVLPQTGRYHITHDPLFSDYVRIIDSDLMEEVALVKSTNAQAFIDKLNEADAALKAKESESKPKERLVTNTAYFWGSILFEAAGKGELWDSFGQVTKRGYASGYQHLMDLGILPSITYFQMQLLKQNGFLLNKRPTHKPQDSRPF